MKRAFCCGIIVFIIGIAGISGWAENVTLQQAEELLADRRYTEASARLQDFLDISDTDTDYAYFLLGNAVFYQQEYVAARDWYAKLLAEFPESSWKYKALFKQAESFVQEKLFEQAQALYEREVTRLVSASRKERIANIYLEFAEEYFTGTWTQRKGHQDLEERPNYERAKAFYELAFQMELGRKKQEEVQFQIARCAFEMGDYGSTITTLQQLQQAFPEGAYVTRTQYLLGQAYLQQGWLMQARQVLRDLTELHPDVDHAPDAAFLLSRTYNMPHPQSDEELELGVKALQDFIEIYHDDPRVSQAEYEVGVAYFNRSRYDYAISAFLAYITKYESVLAALRQAQDDRIAALQDFEGLPLARYNLGLVYQRQRKFEDAITVWQTYLQEHPAHNQWSEVQRQIIETEYMIADRFFREERYDEARTAWERFLTEHPLDYRNPEIMARIGDILFEQEAYQDAIAQWKRTVSKYPGTDPASRAQFEIGRTLETKLLKFEDAFDAYKLVTWGMSSAEAQSRIRKMQAKRLTVLTERVFRTHETAALQITTRNIESLTLKMYHLDLETYFRKMHTTAGVDSLDIALIDPDTVWDVTIKEYERYREFEETVPMPFDEPGAYLVTCSEAKGIEGTGYEATTFVLISDIDIIVKTTKRDLLIFAQNMPIGQPAPETNILVSDGEKIFFESSTGNDGVLHEALEELQDVDDLRIFAYADGNYAATTLSTEALRYVVGLDARGYIYTDRPAYRPGQQVNIRGILREMDEQGTLRVPQHLNINLRDDEASRLEPTTETDGANDNLTNISEPGTPAISEGAPPVSGQASASLNSEPEDLAPGMYHLNVISSQGNPVYYTQVALNEFGSFAVDFALSVSAPTGEYRISVSDNQHANSGTFLVEQYALEKMKLTIETDHDVYFRGETITGRIKAEYYYGEPVREKSVTYSLAGLETLSGVTDEHGEIAFLLDTRNFAESQPITLTARLDDERVGTGKTVWLATRGFTCSISTLRNVYLINEHFEVNFLTKDPAGEALAKDLQFSILKRERTPYGEIAEITVHERSVRTSEEGTGKALIQIAEGGEYVLRAEGIDRFGNPVSGQAELFISDQDDDVKLRILTDREEFRVAETPEVTLFSRASEGLGLLTYEADSILSYQILSLTTEENPLSLSITNEHAPNFTLTITQMEGNRFHQAQKEFAVVQGLNIEIVPLNGEIDESHLEGESQRTEFRPGDTITVEVTTTDHHGNPVPAELSLAMVDEALYAQYADTVPPIREFFYDQYRELLTSTETSCTFQFEAETKEIAEEIVEEEERIATEIASMELMELDVAAGEGVPGKSMAPMSQVQEEFFGDLAMEAPVPLEPSPPPPRRRGEAAWSDDGTGEAKSAAFLAALREYFPETGYWNPHIVTDATGKATVTIQLPDSTTSWRLTSRGITQETLVGEATAGIITKLPFFADIKTPQIFTEGDLAVLLASVHNHSGAQQTVRTTFTANLADDVLEHQEQTATADDGSILEAAYRLNLSRLSDVDQTMPISIELEATSDLMQDRIKREVQIRPWGIEHVATKSGTLRDDRQVDIALPAGQEYLYQRMSILLNPAVESTLLDLVNDVPRIVKAPAASAVHEALVVLNALSFVGSDAVAFSMPTLPGEFSEHLQIRLKALLIDVALRQNQDGGWNWTGQETRSDLFISSDAVILLTLAQQQGYSITPGILPNGIAYLKRAFQAIQDNELKTYLLYALAVAGDLDFAHVNRVYRERNSLTTSGLALLTLIYAEIQRPEIAAELLPLLHNKARRQQDPVTGKQMTFWPSDSAYPYLQGDVETTSLALLAVQKTQPVSSTIAESVEWLDTQRQWLGWGSMRANASVSAALLEYYARAQFQAMRYMLDVQVNDTPIQTVSMDNEQSMIVLHIPADLLQRNNSIRFTFDGRGTLNYVCMLQGVSRDVRKTREHFEVWRHYEPAPLVFQGQEIRRGFSVLDGSYSTWRNKLTQVPLGGFGQVSVQYQQRQYEDRQPFQNSYMILEEPIPAGCSVLEQSIEGDFLDYDIADGAIVFYISNTRYGSLSYDLYGYLPGEYRVLPTKIQSAYQLAQVDYGEPYKITVLDRGEPVTEEYRKTPDELYYYGKALFDVERYAEARLWLRELFDNFRLRPDPYRETARMLMYIAIAENNSREIVQYFEVLKEKYPDLVMAFDDILRVGQAYREIGEFERATQVFKAIAEASFLKDVQVSGSLEAQGEFLSSIDYTRNLLREYPDTPTTEISFYALAQLLATESEAGNWQMETEGESAHTLLERAITMLHHFLVRYPENPIVDEVSFSLANAYLDLEAFDAVIPLVQRFQQRYPKSPFLSGYQYIEGYANFELEHYDEALRLCQTVASKLYPDTRGRMAASDHKDLAQYITGQIYHSMGQPENAITEYEKVKDLFPDAREAINYFTRKELKIEEVSTFQPGESVQIPLTYRNIDEVNLLVYRVDLMTLYLLQKNLNNITQVNLAGITPYHQDVVSLNESMDYAGHEYSLSLPLEEEGAYLVVVKEAEIDTSGMVLLSALKLDVEEDRVSGRVRVNVMNTETGRYENNVHVKVIGSNDSKFISGDTDLRGIMIADNIHGTATVIARKGDQYAFYRGDTALQPPDTSVEQYQYAPMTGADDMRIQATQQLRESNLMIQQQSADYLRSNLYQNKQDGVEVQSAY